MGGEARRCVSDEEKLLAVQREPALASHQALPAQSPGISRSEKDMEAVKALEFGVIRKIILWLVQVIAKLLEN